MSACSLTRETSTRYKATFFEPSRDAVDPPEKICYVHYFYASVLLVLLHARLIFMLTISIFISLLELLMSCAMLRLLRMMNNDSMHSPSLVRTIQPAVIVDDYYECVCRTWCSIFSFNICHKNYVCMMKRHAWEFMMRSLFMLPLFIADGSLSYSGCMINFPPRLLELCLKCIYRPLGWASAHCVTRVSKCKFNFPLRVFFRENALG